MYALTIDNPEIAKLAKEVFSKEPISTNADFYDFLQEQKLKQDLKESIAQAEAGEYLSEEETFTKLYEELEL